MDLCLFPFVSINFSSGCQDSLMCLLFGWLVLVAGLCICKIVSKNNVKPIVVTFHRDVPLLPPRAISNLESSHSNFRN